MIIAITKQDASTIKAIVHDCKPESTSTGLEYCVIDVPEGA